MNLGGPELLILVGLAVLIFGAGWLPKAARNLGKAKVEFDEVQRQFNEAKDSVVESSGAKELEATVRKANKVMKASPQQLMKDAARSAVTGKAASAADEAIADDDIEDAEIVSDDDRRSSAAGSDDTNINVDFGKQSGK